MLRGEHTRPTAQLMSELQGSPASPEGRHSPLEQARPAPHVIFGGVHASPASPVGAAGPVSAVPESSASVMVLSGPESVELVAPEPTPALVPALVPELPPALVPVLVPALAPALLAPELAPVLVPD